MGHRARCLLSSKYPIIERERSWSSSISGAGQPWERDDGIWVLCISAPSAGSWHGMGQLYLYWYVSVGYD